jgi:hypothetical protein
MLSDILNIHERGILDKVRAHCRKVWVANNPFPKTPWLQIHGQPHSEAVINVLNELLEHYMDGTLRLNQSEVLVLMGAALLHDIGLLPEKEESGYDFEQAEINHPERGYTHILKNLSVCGGEKAGPIIALCVKSHEAVPLKENEYVDRVIGGRIIRLQFLVALLKLAEDLELAPAGCPGPFLTQLVKFEKRLPRRTIQQWIRHYYTERIELKKDARDGNFIGIIFHSYIPVQEYRKFVLEPLIVQPIKSAVFETCNVLAGERFFLNTVVGLDVMVVEKARDPLTPSLYSSLKREVLEHESLRNIVRYDYHRVCRFLSWLDRKDRIFDSNIVRVENSLGYTLTNTSNDSRWISGSGEFFSASTDVYEHIGKYMSKDSVKKKIGFQISIDYKGKALKPFVEYVKRSEMPDSPENMTVDDVASCLAKFKPFEDKVFCSYELRREKRSASILCRYMYLAPLKPAATARFRFSWLTTLLPWDAVSTTLRNLTKGLTIAYENFPITYQFSMTASLLVERGEKSWQRSEPIFVTKRGEAAKNFSDRRLFAPGTQIVVQWRDTSLSLRPHRRSKLSVFG